jgi:hypothetical protein
MQINIDPATQGKLAVYRTTLAENDKRLSYDEVINTLITHYEKTTYLS